MTLTAGRDGRRAVALSRIGTLPATPLLLSPGLNPEDNMEMVVAETTALGAARAMLRLETDSRIFFLWFDPANDSIDLANLIDGFLLGAEANDVLVVAIVLPPDSHRAFNFLRDDIAPLFQGPVAMFNEQVVFVRAPAEAASVSALRDLADVDLAGPGFDGARHDIGRAVRGAR